MTDAATRLFVSKLARRLGNVAKRMAVAASESKAISASLHVLNLDFGAVAVETPYYWAIFYHDGRRGFRARPGHKLVYFRNIEQDPRVRGRNYPVKPSDVRKLTEDQFYRMLRDRSSGMIVRDWVGPAPAHPFFTQGLKPFPALALRIGEARFHNHVRTELADILQLKIITSVVI